MSRIHAQLIDIADEMADKNDDLQIEGQSPAREVYLGG
jgi:hypothetical protein